VSKEPSGWPRPPLIGTTWVQKAPRKLQVDQIPGRQRTWLTEWSALLHTHLICHTLGDAEEGIMIEFRSIPSTTTQSEDWVVIA
jgi:hypothetical protein